MINLHGPLPHLPCVMQGWPNWVRINKTCPGPASRSKKMRISIAVILTFVGLAFAAVEEACQENFVYDLEKGELHVDGCGCGVRPMPPPRPQPAPHPHRHRHRRRQCSSSSSSSESSCSSSSSSSSCTSSSSAPCCVPKPPYPMPPRGCGCPSSESSSSSSSCSHHFPTHCPNKQALETVVALDRQFVDYINQGNLAAALAMARADATFDKVDEVVNPVPFGPLCESSKGSLSQLLPTYGNTWLIDYTRCARVKDDYSVAVSNVEISYLDRDILKAANDVIRIWTPTYGCNFKLTNWSLYNLVCKPQVIRDVLDS